jgi:hypothetical protein
VLVAIAWLAAPARAADPDLLLWLKFDETSGTLAADASGKGHIVTVVTGSGTPEWVVGRKENALEIAGLTETRARRVQVPWSSSLAVTDQLTAMSWIRLRDHTHGGGGAPGGSSDQNVVGRSSSTDWRLLVRQSDEKISFLVDTGSTRVTLTGDVPGSGLDASTWYHIAATYDGSHMRIYLNGIELTNRTCSGSLQISSSTSIPLGVGAFPESATSWVDGFPGALDEVKIWKRALTATEIVTEMNGGAPPARLQWRENF